MQEGKPPESASSRPRPSHVLLPLGPASSHVLLPLRPAPSLIPGAASGVETLRPERARSAFFPARAARDGGAGGGTGWREGSRRRRTRSGDLGGGHRSQEPQRASGSRRSRPGESPARAAPAWGLRLQPCARSCGGRGEAAVSASGVRGTAAGRWWLRGAAVPDTAVRCAGTQGRAPFSEPLRDGRLTAAMQA